MSSHPITDTVEPAPHDQRVGPAALLLALIGGPAAWIVQHLVQYGLTSYACYPGRTPRDEVLPGFGWVWSTSLAFNIAALLLALAAAAAAYRNWCLTREEHRGGAGELVEAGEGRTRFLSLWGILAGLGFALAIAFNMIALFVVPLCSD